MLDRLLNGQQQTGPECRVKAQEHRHDIVMPVKPARVPQSVEQEIAPKGIKQAYQHQHNLQGALTLHTLLRFALCQRRYQFAIGGVSSDICGPPSSSENRTVHWLSFLCPQPSRATPQM